MSNKHSFQFVGGAG